MENTNLPMVIKQDHDEMMKTVMDRYNFTIYPDYEDRKELIKIRMKYYQALVDIKKEEEADMRFMGVGVFGLVALASLGLGGSAGLAFIGAFLMVALALRMSK